MNTTVRVPKEFWESLGYSGFPKEPTEKAYKLAMKWAAAEVIRRSKPAGGKRLDLAETFELYKEENPDLVSAKTILKAEVNMANLLEFFGAYPPFPDEIDISDATKYRNWRMKKRPGEKEVSPRTIRNELNTLRQMVRFAFDWYKKTGSQAVRLVHLPEIPTLLSEKIVLSYDQFGKAMEVATPRDRLILGAGVNTMLRKENLLGLHTRHFRLDEYWMHIPGEELKGRKTRIRPPLSVPVSDWTVEIVNEASDGNAGYLWPNDQTGEPLGWFEHRLEEIAKAAKIPKFSLQALRRTGSSWLRNNGADELAISVLMAHRSQASGNVTRLYTRVFTDTLRKVVGIFDEIRRGNGWI